MWAAMDAARQSKGDGNENDMSQGRNDHILVRILPDMDVAQRQYPRSRACGDGNRGETTRDASSQDRRLTSIPLISLEVGGDGRREAKEMKMKIRNINEKYGEPIEFEAQSIDQALVDMAQAIIACGNDVSLGLTTDEMADTLREGVDYEVIDD